MIWTKFIKFVARYWHWLALVAGVIVVSVLTVRQCDSARVYVFGPADRVTVKVK